MVLTQKPINNIYLGEYIEPTPPGGYIDFTTTTLADLTSAWRSSIWSVWLDSWWYFCSNSSNNQSCKLFLPIDTSSMDCLYIKAEINWVGGTWAGWPEFWICTQAVDDWVGVWYPAVTNRASFTNYSASYAQQGVWFNNASWTQTSSYDGAVISWNLTLECYIYFSPSPYATYSISTINKTLSLSSDINQCQYLCVAMWHWIQTATRVKNFEWRFL